MLKDWVSTRPRSEVTRTQYDEPLSGLSVPGFTQNHLRLRVASTCFYAEWDDVNGPDAVLGYEHATHYSYDIHGNVKTLIQEHPQLGLDGGTIADECVGCIDHRYKRMDYSYDLISGNVKRVDYQKDQPDRFHHSYTYDADNRITEVETSADGQNWHRDARYFYYPHGPLERVELGEHLVQGMDYAYTLQGWLKGINGDRLNPTTDMGLDGDPTVTSNPNLLAGRDAYALSLGYYGDADYKGIASTWDDNTPANIVQRPIAPIGASGTANTVAETHKPLYNGNIAHTVNTLQHFGLWDAGNGAQGQVLAQVYHYDQLNRLKKARGFIGLTNANTWSGVVDAAENRYRSQYEYDANGNIVSAERFDLDQNHYDSFSYKYEKKDDRVARNRLYQLDDIADDDNDWVNETGGAQDIEWTGALTFNEEDPDINTNYNYGYDALGNMVRDDRANILTIDWTVAGKVREVDHATGMGPDLSFAYGADGQRIVKTVGYPEAEVPTGYREHYIRDAQGNIMATYRFTNTIADGVSLKLTERPVYGSSRLGTLRKADEELRSLPSFDPFSANPIQQIDLNYELTDHLGNVCAVVTGRLLDGNGGGTPKQADLLSAQGYEAFGSLLPGRSFSSGRYRLGFQGHLKDDELKGTGNWYSLGDYGYEPRIGRRARPDPHAQGYPNLSPYAFVANNPLNYIDPNGKDIVILNDPNGANGAGHQAVLISDGQGGWNYVSKDSYEGTVPYGAKPIITIQNFKSIEDFANSEHNLIRDDDGNIIMDANGSEQQRYTKGYLIKTDPKTDPASFEAAKKEVNSNYNLGFDDCSHVCTEAIESAKTVEGKDVKSGEYNPTVIIPATRYTPAVISPDINFSPNEKQRAIQQRNEGTDISNQLVPK